MPESNEGARQRIANVYGLRGNQAPPAGNEAYGRVTTMPPPDLTNEAAKLLVVWQQQQAQLNALHERLGELEMEKNRLVDANEWRGMEIERLQTQIGQERAANLKQTDATKQQHEKEMSELRTERDTVLDALVHLQIHVAKMVTTARSQRDDFLSLCEDVANGIIADLRGKGIEPSPSGRSELSTMDKLEKELLEEA